MGDVTPLQIGPCAIIRLLYDGKFESIYLGKQQGRAKNYSTIHVFHILLATNEDREAFLARAKSLKKLKHRNIAETLDYGLLPNDEQPATRGYLVTQYVSEKSILERFPQGQLAMPDEVKRALSPIADALQYAHASHIFHHHLHPGSILIDESKQFLLAGFSPQPLLSFIDDADALPYMSPEALQGQPGPASDQYSLGVMVYEWLCGQRPYSATERETLLRQQQSAPLPRAAQPEQRHLACRRTGTAQVARTQPRRTLPTPPGLFQRVSTRPHGLRRPFSSDHQCIIKCSDNE